MQDVWTQEQMIEHFWSAANKGLEDEVIKNHSIDPKLLAIRLVAVHAAAEGLGGDASAGLSAAEGGASVSAVSADPVGSGA